MCRRRLDAAAPHAQEARLGDAFAHAVVVHQAVEQRLGRRVVGELPQLVQRRQRSDEAAPPRQVAHPRHRAAAAAVQALARHGAHDTEIRRLEQHQCRRRRAGRGQPAAVARQRQRPPGQAGLALLRDAQRRLGRRGVDAREPAVGRCHEGRCTGGPLQGLADHRMRQRQALQRLQIGGVQRQQRRGFGVQQQRRRWRRGNLRCKGRGRQQARPCAQQRAPPHTRRAVSPSRTPICASWPPSISRCSCSRTAGACTPSIAASAS